MHACVSTPLCLEKLEPEVAALTSRPLGRGRKWGFFPKPLGPYWRGSDPWKGWFRRGERLVAGSQFGVLGTKAASLKSKKVCVCVCVCVCGRQGARRGGGDGHSWRRMLGHFAVKASFDLWS